MSNISVKLATLTVIMALAAGSAAFAGPAGAGGQKDAQNLGTITITGNKLRLLQDIKAALKRQFSYAAADRDTMVCRIQTPTGSRLHKALVCGTNHDWYTRADHAEITWGALLRAAGRGTTPSAQQLQGLRAIHMAFQLPLVSAADFKRFIQSVPSAKPAADATTPKQSDRHD